MGIYGISLAAATLVGYGLSGVIVSHMGYQALFLLGAVMLVIGAGISLLLPRADKTRGLSTQTSSGGGFKQVRDLLGRRGLTVAYCSIFAQYFTFGGVVTLLPLYAKGLGMEAFHIAMLMATFAVMFIIIQLPGGALSDKIGRLIPIVIGLSLGIISLIILPLVVIFPLLAGVMALYGIAYGILFPSVSALVTDHTIPEERGIATGMFHALLTAGVAIGAPVAGWVGEALGVELGLVSITGIMVLALVIAVAKLRAIPA